MPKIHSTAIVDSAVTLGDDVEIGPYCVIEPDVEIGQGTVLRSHAVIRSHTRLGSGNVVDSFVTLGGEPQDLKFDKTSVSYLRIGDNNVFREGVTISRATGQGKATVICNGTYWMTESHAGHNCLVHDGIIMTNGAALGGYVELGASTILSGHTGVHQFCWVGEMVIYQGNSIITMHVPPYVMGAMPRNRIVGLNTVGLRRAGHISDEDRRQIKEAFRITYRSSLTPTKALEKMDACTDWGLAAGKFRDFIRRVLMAEPPYNRGLCPFSRKKTTL